MEPIFFQTIDWTTIPVTEYSGETGIARWQTVQHENFRMRIVEYSKGYRADHWCAKGHIVFCLDGELVSELSDGRIFTLKAGMSYQVSDDVSRHRSSSKEGVRLLIVDGTFLKNNRPVISNPWKM
jgi:quercetin dioxygenase-like cupin family protein